MNPDTYFLRVLAAARNAAVSFMDWRKRRNSRQENLSGTNASQNVFF